MCKFHMVNVDKIASLCIPRICWLENLYKFAIFFFDFTWASGKYFDAIDDQFFEYIETMESGRRSSIQLFKFIGNMKVFKHGK